MFDTSTLLDMMTKVSNVAQTTESFEFVILAVCAYLAYDIGRIRKIIHKLEQSKKERFTKKFPSILDSNSKVMTCLNHAKASLNADRAVVVQFHNGSSNLSGLDFAKMTCTHEVVRPGLRSSQHNFLNLPVSAFTFLVEMATCDEVRSYVDIKDLKDIDLSTYTFLKHNNKVTSFAICSLVSDSGINFGFIAVEFSARREDVSTEEFKRTLKQYADRIATLLDNNNTGDRNGERTVEEA